MKIGYEAFYGRVETKIWHHRDKTEKIPFDLGRIGQLLRSAREAKGLTFEEIENVLLIRKHVLKAIESGGWDILPPTVYVRGYVTQYASLLDILDMVQAELS